MQRKYATMRHQWDVTQRKKDPSAEMGIKEREITARVCSWKTFIRSETKEINVASMVHSQLVRSRFANKEMCTVVYFQN
jgi:hypothetical protein